MAALAILVSGSIAKTPALQTPVGDAHR